MCFPWLNNSSAGASIVVLFWALLSCVYSQAEDTSVVNFINVSGRQIWLTVPFCLDGKGKYHELAPSPVMLKPSGQWELPVKASVDDKTLTPREIYYRVSETQSPEVRLLQAASCATGRTVSVKISRNSLDLSKTDLVSTLETLKLFRAIGPIEETTYKGTLTVGNETVEIEKLQAFEDAYCRTCGTRVLRLSYSFGDSSFRLPGISAEFRNNRFNLQSEFHGVKADLTFGSELVLVCRNARITEDATTYDGVVMYFRDNAGPAYFLGELGPEDPPITGYATFEIVQKGTKLDGVVVIEGASKFRFSLTRIPSKE